MACSSQRYYQGSTFINGAAYNLLQFFDRDLFFSIVVFPPFYHPFYLYVYDPADGIIIVFLFIQCYDKLYSCNFSFS